MAMAIATVVVHAAEGRSTFLAGRRRFMRPEVSSSWRFRCWLKGSLLQETGNKMAWKFQDGHGPTMQESQWSLNGAICRVK